MSSDPVDVELSGRAFDLPRIEGLYGRPVRVSVSEGVRERVRASRQRVEAILSRDEPYYGINTGIASLCRTRVGAEQLDALQANLLMSHAVGVGEPAPDAVVRLMLLFKAHALGLGYSGIRPETLELVAGLLSRDVLPVVPTRGSLGASGDLAPLAHLSLPLIGRGAVRHGGRVVPAAEGLRAAGLSAVRLRAKEGLALINGTQFMTAYGAALCVRGRRAAKLADVIAAMQLEAVCGVLSPFDERLFGVRRHPGAGESAENVRRVLSGSRRPRGEAARERVQDPYSLRCVPQVHGAVRDVIAHAAEVILRDVNGVTDNPVVFENGDVVSGGNFHGEPVALALDYLATALCELASIAERRMFLVLSGRFGLPAGLVEKNGVNSGLLITQYTAAALTAENKVLAHPASVDSIPTADGQEDHVSMGATAATKCWQIVDNVETVLAIELLAAAQGLDFCKPGEVAPAAAAAHAAVRRRVAHADADRVFAEDIAAARGMAASGELMEAVEAVTGALR